MATLRSLKTSAKDAATWHGHHMRSFSTIDDHSAVACCRFCGMGAWVNSKPAPNGIDIHGEAVALNCKG